ncbi:MAG: acyltransferase [Candidatus Glassbacteria bacterium]|nr:acyltransferase [Candidatus Glassbacteria bacterium]
MKPLRAAAVQFEHAPGDKDANLDKIRRFTAKAAKRGADLVVFPECCITGYYFLRHLSRRELTELAEPVPAGPSTRELARLAAKHNMAVGAGLVELANDGRLYNSWVIALPDGQVHSHRKLHCFVSEHMDSGDEFTVFDTPSGWRLGVLTCYDNNIVENVRATALLGATVILAPHQTGGVRSPDPHTMGLIDRALWDNRQQNPAEIEAELRGDKGRGWLMRWLPSRAHDNGVFYVFANGVGVDDDEVRTGNAMILDTYGRVLAETWKAGDEMVSAELDPVLLERNTGKRWILTRRPELYGSLAESTGRERPTREVRFDGEGV